MRVLVVGHPAPSVRRVLTRAGHAVDVAPGPSAALDRLGLHPYDVLVLDPWPDALELCRATRRAPLADGTCSQLRVLVLSARHGLQDRVAGLDAGADDYLAVPFAAEELLARLRALLRRGRPVATPVLELEDLRLDPATMQVRRGERRVGLTRKEFGVLHYLMRSHGRVISAEELLEHVWDEHADPFTHTVRVTVGTLRRKLTVDGEPALLHTVIGSGYRLTADAVG